MPSLNVDGVSLHYRDEGRGLPVVLLHGFPLHGGAFARQLVALSGKYRLIVPDHRGFGGSGPAAGPLEMSRIARDVLALLDALSIDSAVIGGVSMGGYASLALLREDAGRVRGLVLADSQALADDAAGRGRREASIQQVRDMGIDALVEAMLPKLVAAPPGSPISREVERLMREAAPESVIAAQQGMLRRLDSRELLARFAGPTLVIVGAQDPITPVERAREMAALVPGARLEVIAGAGHLANQEAPDAFNRALDAFLAPIAGVSPGLPPGKG